MVGHVKWWDPMRGYGFIRVDGEQDVFLHHSALGIEFEENRRRNVDEGEELEFDAVSTPKGLQAANVRRP